MRLLVTGGTGALGRHFVKQAAAAGFDVRVLSRHRDAHGNTSRGDLISGGGLDAATAGVEAVIHLASDPRHASAVDVDGTLHLLAASAVAAVRHFVYISIVGVDVIPYPYYQRKRDAERLIMSSGLPYSIVRATQFHSLVDRMLSQLARVPLMMPLPAGFQFQSVAEEEVAGRLLRSVGEGPSNRTVNFGGPEIMRLEAMAETWREVRGRRKRALVVPLPGQFARAFREGLNTAPLDERGIVSWNQWLTRD